MCVFYVFLALLRDVAQAGRIEHVVSRKKGTLLLVHILNVIDMRTDQTGLRSSIDRTPAFGTRLRSPPRSLFFFFFSFALSKSYCMQLHFPAAYRPSCRRAWTAQTNRRQSQGDSQRKPVEWSESERVSSLQRTLTTFPPFTSRLPSLASLGPRPRAMFIRPALLSSASSFVEAPPPDYTVAPSSGFQPVASSSRTGHPPDFIAPILSHEGHLPHLVSSREILDPRKAGAHLALAEMVVFLRPPGMTTLRGHDDLDELAQGRGAKISGFFNVSTPQVNRLSFL